MLKFLAPKAPIEPSKDANGEACAAFTSNSGEGEPRASKTLDRKQHRIETSPPLPCHDRAADQRRPPSIHRTAVTASQPQRQAQPKKQKGYSQADANTARQRSTTAFECSKKRMNARLHSLLGQNTNPAVQRALRYFFCYESDGLYPLFVAVYDLLEKTLRERDELAEREGQIEERLSSGLLEQEEKTLQDIRADVALPSSGLDYVVDERRQKVEARGSASKRKRSKEEAGDDSMDEEERNADKNGISIGFDADDSDNDSEADEFEETEEDRQFICDEEEEEEEADLSESQSDEDDEREVGAGTSEVAEEEETEEEPEQDERRDEASSSGYRREVFKKRRFAVLSDEEEDEDDPVFRMA